MALLYEPANTMGVPCNAPRCVYFSRPPSLPTYLKEFAMDDSSIAICGEIPVKECAGARGKPHLYLEGETVSVCAHCNRHFCSFCAPVWQDPPFPDFEDCKSKPLCMQCFEATCLGLHSDLESGQRQLGNTINLFFSHHLPKVIGNFAPMKSCAVLPWPMIGRAMKGQLE